MNSIALIGGPGAGKSKLGVIVAERLGYSILDGDTELIRYIREREPKYWNCKDPVATKLIELGDDGFIKLEREFYEARFPNGLVDQDGNEIILSSSGSMPLIPEVIQDIKQRGTHILMLDRPASEMEKNCQKRADGVSRIVGLSRFGGDFKALIDYRMKIYREQADSIVLLGGQDASKEDSARIMLHHIEEALGILPVNPVLLH